LSIKHTKFILSNIGTKIVIKGDYISEQEIEVTYNLLDLNNEDTRNSFIRNMSNLIRSCHNQIQSIPNLEGKMEQGSYGLKTNKDENSIVENAINYMVYGCGFNILDFVANIVFNINANHLYHNGNKRTSLFAMSTILDYFGYYLSYSYQENALLEK
jgi:death-on-curing family protein